MGVQVQGRPDRWISINTEPVFHQGDARPAGVVATFVAATEQRRITEELRRARADLELLGAARYGRAVPAVEAALAGTTQTLEQTDPQPDGSERHSLVTLVPEIRQGVVVGVYTLGFDVTPLRQAQDALRGNVRQLEATSAAVRESEHRLHTVADGVPMAIGLFDEAGEILFANAEFARLGDASRGVEGRTTADFFPADIYEQGREARRRALQGEVSRLEVQLESEGEVRVREVTFAPYRTADGRIQGVYALGYDITDIHASREGIRELARRLADAREAERVTLSTTLHERIAQDLFAALLGLRRLAISEDETDRRAAAAEVTAAIELSIGELRRLTNDLIPISLANLPLATTLRLYAEDFTARAGLGMKFEVTGPQVEASVEVRLPLFRVLQQVLNGLRWDERGAAVKVKLSFDGEELALVVTLEGTRLDEAADRESGAHALLFFEERLRAFGGTFSVERSAQGGSIVAARVPQSMLRTPKPLVPSGVP